MANIDNVLRLSQAINALDMKIAQLSAERVALIRELTPLLKPDYSDAGDGGLTERVRAHILGNPLIEHDADSVAAALCASDRLPTIRSALIRLMNDGAIHRRSRGKYASTPQEDTSWSPPPLPPEVAP